jgi:hypothetical protein
MKKDNRCKLTQEQKNEIYITKQGRFNGASELLKIRGIQKNNSIYIRP